MEIVPGKLSGWDKTLVVVVGLLLMVWPTAHTAALRNLLLIATLLLCLGRSSSHALSEVNASLRRHPASVPLAILTAWILFHTLFFAADFSATCRELASQWVKPLWCFLLGALVARRMRSVHSWALVVAIALTFHLIAWGVDTTFAFVTQGSFVPRRASLYGGDYGVESYVATLLLALSLADATCRSVLGERLIPVPGPVALCLGMAVTGWSLLLGARNGVLVAVVLLSATTILIARHYQLEMVKRSVAIAGGVLAVGFAAGMLTMDDRWSAFSEKAQISWNLSSSPAWYTGDAASLPKIANGSQVDASTYYRISWLHAGLNYIAQYPLGVGYSRHAFGLVRHWEHPESPPSGYSHSSVIDWSLGIGLPGTVLWILVLILTVRAGMRSFVGQRNPAGILLVLIALDFFVRSIIDSNMRDHSLAMFLFLIGMLGTLVAPEPNLHERNICTATS